MEWKRQWDGLKAETPAGLVLRVQPRGRRWIWEALRHRLRQPDHQTILAAGDERYRSEQAAQQAAEQWAAGQVE